MAGPLAVKRVCLFSANRSRNQMIDLRHIMRSGNFFAVTTGCRYANLHARVFDRVLVGTALNIRRIGNRHW